MRFDLMAGADHLGRRRPHRPARSRRPGFSGMLFTETSQTPWMSIAAAATAAPTLEFTTGIAVAFPRSPMVSAALAWELAENTGGRFRLGLGSQVKAHVERRYGADFDPPGPRMRDYVLAVQACLRAFRGEERLAPRRALLPAVAAAARSGRPAATTTATSRSTSPPSGRGCADDGRRGGRRHPRPPVPLAAATCTNGCCPRWPRARRAAGRDPDDVDLIIPVFAVPGDTPEERAPLLERARCQIAFYGSTKNYAFQFDDLGFEGTSATLNERLKAGDLAGMAALDHRRDARALRRRRPLGRAGRHASSPATGAIATRLVMYLAEQSIRRDPSTSAAGARWPGPSPPPDASTGLRQEHLSASASGSAGTRPSLAEGRPRGSVTPGRRPAGGRRNPSGAPA